MDRDQSKRVLKRSCHRFLRASVMVVCSGLLLSVGLLHATERIIEVTDVAWTDGVRDHQYLQQYDESAPCQPLYFWMRIQGKQRALERLRAEGKLPIRHKWFKLVGEYKNWEENPELKTAVNLSIGREAQLSKLELELENRAFFDWRTWSMKENVRPGWWRVVLVYADDEPVQCGENNEDCEWDIEIR